MAPNLAVSSKAVTPITRAEIKALFWTTLFVLSSMVFMRLEPIFDLSTIALAGPAQAKILSLIFVCQALLNMARLSLSQISLNLTSKSEGKEQRNTAVRGVMTVGWLVSFPFGAISTGIALYMSAKNGAEVSQPLVAAICVSMVGTALALMNGIARFALFTSLSKPKILRIDLQWIVSSMLVKLALLLLFKQSAYVFLMYSFVNAAEQLGIIWNFSSHVSYRPRFSQLREQLSKIRSLLGPELVQTITLATESLLFAFLITRSGASDLVAPYTVAYSVYCFLMSPQLALATVGVGELARAWDDKETLVWNKILRKIRILSVIYSGLFAGAAAIVFAIVYLVFKKTSDARHVMLMAGYGLAAVPVILSASPTAYLRVFERVINTAMMWALSTLLLAPPLFLLGLHLADSFPFALVLAIVVPRIIMMLGIYLRAAALKSLRYKDDRMPIKNLGVVCKIAALETESGQVALMPKPMAQTSDLGDAGAYVVGERNPSLSVGSHISGEFYKNGEMIFTFMAAIRHVQAPRFFHAEKTVIYDLEFDREQTRVDWWEILFAVQNSSVSGG